MFVFSLLLDLCIIKLAKFDMIPSSEHMVFLVVSTLAGYMSITIFSIFRESIDSLINSSITLLLSNICAYTYKIDGTYTRLNQLNNRRDMKTSLITTETFILTTTTYV